MSFYCSFHVGSGCMNPSAYSRAIEMSHYVFEYGKTVGYDFNLLDIGGGFPGHGGSDKIFEDMSCAINGSLQKYFNNDRVTVIAEPGTYFARSPSTLVVNVVNKRLVRQEDGSQVRFEMYSVLRITQCNPCLMHLISRFLHYDAFSMFFIQSTIIHKFIWA